MSSLLYRLSARKARPTKLAPRMVLSTAVVGLAVTAGGGTVAGTIVISNDPLSGGRLNRPSFGTVSYGASATGYLTPSIAQHVNGIDWVLTCTADETGIDAGQHQATFQVWVVGATGGPQTVTVNFVKTAAGVAILQPAWSTNDTISGVVGSSSVTPTSSLSTKVRNVGGPGTAIANLQASAPADAWCTVDPRQDANGEWWVDFTIVGAEVAQIPADGVYSTYTDVSDANAAATVRITQPLDLSQPAPSGQLTAVPSTAPLIFAVGETAPKSTTVRLRGTVPLTAPQVTEALAYASATVAVDPLNAAEFIVTILVDPATLADGATNGTLQATDPSCTNTVTINLAITKQAVAGAFPAIPFTLPSGMSHDTSTDAVTWDPFSSPADDTGFVP